MRGTFWIPRRRLVGSLAAALLVIAGCGPERELSQYERFANFVSELRGSPPTTVQQAEALVGVRLPLIEDRREVARFYAVNEAEIAGIPADQVKFQIPAITGTQAMLWVRIQDVCLDRARILLDYGPLPFVSDASPHSLYSETTLGRDEPWGRLGFGFDQVRPECLRSILAFVDLPQTDIGP